MAPAVNTLAIKEICTEVTTDTAVALEFMDVDAALHLELEELYSDLEWSDSCSDLESEADSCDEIDDESEVEECGDEEEVREDTADESNADQTAEEAGIAGEGHKEEVRDWLAKGRQREDGL